MKTMPAGKFKAKCLRVMAEGLPLVTRDSKLRRSRLVKTVW